MSTLWRNYSLSVTLACLWLVSWVIQTVSGWMEYSSEQHDHGLAPELTGYVWVWLRTTFENNSSEFLQLFTMVVLTAYLVHRGSGEGKQQQEQADRTETKVDATIRAIQRLERHLTRLEQADTNRRLLQEERADHPFEPFYTGDGGGQLTVCGVRGCVLGAAQHPKTEADV